MDGVWRPPAARLAPARSPPCRDAGPDGAGAARSLPRACGNGRLGRRRRESDGLRPGAFVHPDLPVGRPQPARHLGPQTRRPRGDPRRVRQHRHERAGDPDQRALPPARRDGASIGDHPLDESRRLRPPVDGAPGSDRSSCPGPPFRRGRPLGERLAAPGGLGGPLPPDARGSVGAGCRDDALDRRAPGRPRRQGPGPARRLARQGVRPVLDHDRPQRPRFPGRRARPARRRRCGSDARPSCPPRSAGRRESRKRSAGDRPPHVGRVPDAGARTRWLRPRHAVHSRSSARTRGSATATAGTSTASACSWLGGWSRRASPWSRSTGTTTAGTSGTRTPPTSAV